MLLLPLLPKLAQTLQHPRFGVLLPLPLPLRDPGIYTLLLRHPTTSLVRLPVPQTGREDGGRDDGF